MSVKLPTKTKQIFQTTSNRERSRSLSNEGKSFSSRENVYRFIDLESSEPDTSSVDKHQFSSVPNSYSKDKLGIKSKITAGSSVTSEKPKTAKTSLNISKRLESKFTLPSSRRGEKAKRLTTSSKLEDHETTSSRSMVSEYPVLLRFETPQPTTQPATSTRTISSRLETSEATPKEVPKPSNRPIFSILETTETSSFKSTTPRSIRPLSRPVSSLLKTVELAPSKPSLSAQSISSKLRTSDSTYQSTAKPSNRTLSSKIGISETTLGWRSASLNSSLRASFLKD